MEDGTGAMVGAFWNDLNGSLPRQFQAGERMEKKGSYCAVGLGMMLGAHVSPRARSEIEQADVVFGLVSDAIVELWLQDMRPDMRSLQPFYADGKRRTDSYREMIDAMMAEVRSGHRVCGVFYGHPGVFAQVPHHAVAAARAEDYDAEMHPGISAEDCLYADLGIDPGTFGCQHFEASQFMFYRRRIDPSAYLVLWQIGLAGDRSVSRFSTDAPYRRLLVELLEQEGYPSDHEVIVYEAATLPISTPRMERMALSALITTQLFMQSTLVVPPCRPMQRNEALLRRLEALEASGEASGLTSARCNEIELHNESSRDWPRSN
jgi:precorrin-6B methylase 1